MLQLSSPFMEKLHKRNLKTMWLQQWAISHIVQTNCNWYPVDNESILTLLCHQKTINWKDIALWFVKDNVCIFCLTMRATKKKLEVKRSDLNICAIVGDWWNPKVWKHRYIRVLCYFKQCFVDRKATNIKYFRSWTESISHTLSWY
jgi:hypothetical protein